MGQTNSSTSKSLSESSSCDPDETWYLPGEVERLTAKWEQAADAEVPKFFRDLRAKEIEEPPKFMMYFLPEKTSSRTNLLAQEDSDWDRFLAANLNSNGAPPRGQKRKQLPGHPCDCCEGAFKSLDVSDETVQKLCRHKAYLPRPKTPDQFWNVSWWLSQDPLNKTQ